LSLLLPHTRSELYLLFLMMELKSRGNATMRTDIPNNDYF
jgi:hypothetical protein